MVGFPEKLSSGKEEVATGLDEEKCSVPWISRRARPDGVWMREGNEFEVAGVSNDWCGWSGMDGIAFTDR